MLIGQFAQEYITFMIQISFKIYILRVLKGPLPKI